MSPRRWLPAVCVVLTIPTAITTVVCRPCKRATTPIPTGLYSARQIMNRAGPLCQALAPDVGEMELSVDRTAGLLPHPLWIASATDRLHRNVVNLRWNDDTGELYEAGHLETRPYDRADRPLSRRQGIAAATKWMRILGFAKLSPRWRLVRPPECRYAIWSMVWRAERREAFVRVHAYTGSLIWLQIRQIPVAPGASVADRGHDIHVAGLNAMRVPL